MRPEGSQGQPILEGKSRQVIDCAWEVWRERIPPVLLVIDEPHLRTQFHQELEKRAKRNSAAAAWLLKSHLPAHGVICTMNGGSLMPLSKTEQLHPEAKQIVIDVVDKQAAAVVDGLNKLRAARFHK